MRNEQAIRKLEKQTEESMSPRDWAVLLADRIASYETADEYCAAQAQATNPDESPHFRPLAVYRRLLILGDSEALRAAEVEYRTLCQLSMDLNREFVTLSEREQLRYGLVISLCYLLTQPPEPGAAKTDGDRQGGATGGTMGIAELADNMALRLAVVRTHLGAVELLSQERFLGHPFIAKSPLRALRAVEAGLDGLLQRLGRFRAGVGEQLPDQVVPAPASVRALADCWLHAAQQEVRSVVSPDRQRLLQDFRAICGGHYDVEIAYDLVCRAVTVE